MNEVAPITPTHRMTADEQRALIAKVRDARRAFVLMLHEIGGTDPQGGRMKSANLTLAMRHVEDAESRAERHIRNGHRE